MERIYSSKVKREFWIIIPIFLAIWIGVAIIIAGSIPNEAKFSIVYNSQEYYFNEYYIDNEKELK
jgi:hypothetical protein